MAARARRSPTTPSCCCSTPTTRSGPSPCRAARFGDEWALELSTADSLAEAGSKHYGARTEVPVAAHSSRDAQAGRVMGELRATYRLQLTPDFGFAAARELVPYLRDLGISHLYLVPDTPGAAGFDPRLRRDRPRPAVGRARGRGRVPHPGCRRGRRRTGARARRRSQPHGRRRWQPILGRSRAARAVLRPRPGRAADGGASSTSTSSPGCARRIREVFAATHEKLLALVGEGLVDGLRVDHPDGLADPAGYLERLRSRGRRAGVGGEDPRSRASACATGR